MIPTGNVIIDAVLLAVGNAAMFLMMSVQAFLMSPAAFISAVFGM